MPPTIDLTGQVFSRLTVLSRNHDKKTRGSMWNCLCECGGEKVVSLDNLRAGKIRSCGCLRSEVVSAMRTSHGYAKPGQVTPIYSVWVGMKGRCYNPSNPKYVDYGGRGITVCDRWKDSFENFVADMGEIPGDDYTIDRIDNNGNYEPGNCRWTTILTQANNRRDNIHLTHEGRTQTAGQWARELGVSYGNLYYHVVLKDESLTAFITRTKT